VSALETVASDRFRFRFVTRGEKANALVVLAMRSLRRCHPNVAILLIDANDAPVFHDASADVVSDLHVIHISPDEDDVAQVAGRGSRRHLFYWRHSPQVLAALPPSDRYAVYADGDIIFLRPMDLASLIRPLKAGRIAATVDESSIDYYGRLGKLAPGLSGMLPAAGSGGPLLQSGLIFTNPADNDRFYNRFWELAVAVARSGHLTDLPFDDMCLVTALLGQGGPLWERLLPLGHEWNYITDAHKDPGIFGCAAHYGGHRAKSFILGQWNSLFPAANTSESWGTVAVGTDDTRTVVRGSWQCQGPGGLPLSVPVPFALSWLIPPDVCSFDFSAVLPQAAEVAFFIYVDGRLTDRIPAHSGCIQTTVRFARAETVTVIGVSGPDCRQILLGRPFEAQD
jgi:hypothetical protein